MEQLLWIFTFTVCTMRPCRDTELRRLEIKANYGSDSSYHMRTATLMSLDHKHRIKMPLCCWAWITALVSNSAPTSAANYSCCQPNLTSDFLKNWNQTTIFTLVLESGVYKTKSDNMFFTTVHSYGYITYANLYITPLSNCSLLRYRSFNHAFKNFASTLLHVQFHAVVLPQGWASRSVIAYIIAYIIIRITSPKKLG